jgi:hypothetical protein
MKALIGGGKAWWKFVFGWPAVVLLPVVYTCGCVCTRDVTTAPIPVVEPDLRDFEDERDRILNRREWALPSSRRSDA